MIYELVNHDKISQKIKFKKVDFLFNPLALDIDELAGLFQVSLPTVEKNQIMLECSSFLAGNSIKLVKVDLDRVKIQPVMIC